MTQKPKVDLAIEFTIEGAEDLSYALSDVLCWCDGFYAARQGTDLTETGPNGLQRLRDFNIKLKKELNNKDPK